MPEIPSKISDRCAFCTIVACDEPATVLREWHGVLAIEPLNPVTAGHVIVFPTEHVDDALEDPDVTAKVMHAAAEMAIRPCNIITSVGHEATQSVFHLHVHIVPRSEGDGLALPWTDQRESAYRAGREDAARRVLDPLLRLRDIAETDKRGREQDGDGEGVMCCVQYLDGLNIAINLLSHQLGEDQDTPEGREDDA